MTIKDLITKAHQTAIDKGFWEKIDTNLDVDTLKGYTLKERNISELLMLIVTELGEACEALRKGNRQAESICNKEYACDACPTPDECWKKDTFEDEIADAVIRIADLCGALNIDLEWQLRNKMEYNKNRPHKHGKKF